MNTYNVCDTYMGEQGAWSILALVQIGLLAQPSTPAVVAVALAMAMMKAFLLLLGYLSDTSPLGHRTVSNLDMNY